MARRCLLPRSSRTGSVDTVKEDPMSETAKEQNGSPVTYTRKLTFYHPASSGNGAAMQLEPRVNRREADRYNCFFMEMAAQKTVSGRDGAKKVFATFDWANKLTVKLEFLDVCELLSVLEGRQEQAGGQRNGLYHETERATTVITCLRNKAEKGGYLLGLSRKDKGTGTLAKVHMVLSEAEGVGLRSVFQAGLFFVTFHTHLWSSRLNGAPAEPAGEAVAVEF